MKKFVPVLFSLLLFGSVLAAQDDMDDDMTPADEDVSSMQAPKKSDRKSSKDPQFTEEQKEKIKTIKARAQEKKKLLRDETKKRTEEINAAMHTEIKALLTPEQVQKYDQRIERMQNLRKKRVEKAAQRLEKKSKPQADTEE